MIKDKDIIASEKVDEEARKTEEKMDIEIEKYFRNIVASDTHHELVCRALSYLKEDRTTMVILKYLHYYSWGLKEIIYHNE